MTQLWMDGFDHYGIGADGAARMLEGPWAEIEVGNLDLKGLQAPDFGARTGSNCFVFDTNQKDFARRVIGQDTNHVIISMGFYVDQLPNADARVIVASFQPSAQDTSAVLFVDSDGQLVLRGPSVGFNAYGSGAVQASSSGPAIQAGTWHHIEIEYVRHASAGTCEVRVDEVVVINASGIAGGSSILNQLIFGTVPSIVGVSIPRNHAIDDLILRDDQGTRNNGFEGDLRVATLVPVEDAAAQGWTARPVEKLGVGVFDCLDDGGNDQALAFDDDTALEIGSGEFAIEGFYRFHTNLLATARSVLASKWEETNDLRSYRLMLNGPDVGGNLVFETCTNGLVGDVVQVQGFPWIPNIDQWYHIAVTRDGTNSRLFIDGIQKGTTVTDNRTYFNGAAQFFVNNQQDNVSNTAVDDLSVDGWIDAFRLTVGDSRYVANFNPPTAALVDDANTALLLNFDDEAILDESTNAFVGVALNNAFVDIPADGPEAYKTINGLAPNDNNWIEAALIPAQQTLTLVGQPGNNETVTVGATTYTFETVLTDSANFVLIGATAADSLDNLRFAINLESGAGTLYGTGTTQNASAFGIVLPNDQMLVFARTPGAAGNSIISTETLADGSWTDTTFDGGQDIPGESEFVVSQLPPEVTGVKSVAIIGRNYKLDSGAAKMTQSFVHFGGSATVGAESTLTLNPVYYEDTFEVDPSTAGDLTPSSILGSKIRVDRTL